MNTIDTKTFLESQFIDTNLNRYDILVRCIAIDEFNGLNDYGFNMYNKMQKLRVGNYVGYENKFKKLITSIKKNGYDKNYPVGTAKEILCDGSHRISCVINFDLPEVYSEPIKGRDKVSYKIAWFKKNFTAKEINRIEQKRLEIFDHYGFYFYVMLWNSVTPYFDDIEADIAKKYKILDSRTETMNADFIREIYKCDDIAPWKVEKKIQNMKGRGSTFRILKIDIPNPKWRNKEATGKPLSQAGEKIKHTYRDQYTKKVPNYFHDIIIHTTDNFEQTAFIEKAIDEMYPRS